VRTHMKINNELLLLNGMNFLLILAILFHPTGPERLFLGLPFILFFPGYSFIAFLSPGKKDLTLLQRVMFSTALSLVSFPLVGLLLNYTPWGITVDSTLISLSVIMATISAAAWWRRQKLPIDERFILEFYLPLPRWRRASLTDRAINAFLILTLLLALSVIGRAYFFPKVEERFTEFYILGPSEKIAYPSSIEAETLFTVIVGVKNLEGQEITYIIETKLEGEQPLESGVLTIEDGQVKEKAIRLSLPREGKYSIEFLLYREGDENPYRELWLWLNVRKRGAQYTDFQVYIQPDALKNRTIPVYVIITNNEGEDKSYQVFAQGSWQAGRPISELYLAKSEIIKLADGQSRGPMHMLIEVPIHPEKATNERIYFYLFEVGKFEPSQVVSIPIRSFRFR